MIESRCGILCSECFYREQVGCKGCVNVQKPFWGESCPFPNPRRTSAIPFPD
ncbi:hypothetical protein AALA79_00835 [Lachnospiraceae bacterium 64-25]|nr:hypothetical protein IMSAGC005_03773 [Lachnospiraceae bacterium]